MSIRTLFDVLKSRLLPAATRRQVRKTHEPRVPAHHPHNVFIGLVAGALLAIVWSAEARAQTTVPITGIGTQIAGPPFTIDTHVDSVTFWGPAVVQIEGVGEVLEIRGFVSGVGWGGGPTVVARAANAHYEYEIPFVARWRARGQNQNLVVFHHGGGPALLNPVLRDEALLGEANPHRFAELAGDSAFGIPALLNHCVYYSTNRRGLRGDGTFSATYLSSEVAPLTDTEVAAIHAQLPSGFMHPGIVPGAPVPALVSTDAPTFRDIARALEEVLGSGIGTSFHTRICSGNSSGARLGAFLNFGRSVIGAQSVRTGGNHVDPYNPDSPRIFDGFILNGYPYVSGADNADSEQPISAPVFFLQGRADERYQQSIQMAHELLSKGVPLDDAIRIYEVKGLNHVPRDLFYQSVQPTGGDTLGCFVSAAIQNMGEWLLDGWDPPVSRIAGRIEGGLLVIDQAGGTTTNVAPVLEDPAIDILVPGEPMIVPRTIGPTETARWLAVTEFLAHENDAITPPAIACRVGGYRIKFFGVELLPFAPATLDAIYGGYEGYLECVEDVVADLEAERLYDSRVESAKRTAERSEELFGD
jgi:hypothetical protein